MKFTVVDRGDKYSQELSAQFVQLAGQQGLTLDREAPDVVVSIGGDGTMLQAFHLYKGNLEHTAFVGIHTGRLGFFADWKPEELGELVHQMASPAQGVPRIVTYPLVDIEIVTEAGVERHLALNEFALRGTLETLVAQLNINDDPFEMFRGDGICISTPSGSTAYNKSLGGAILHPSLDTLQIAEIASINNRVYRTLGSSIVLPKHHHCDIYPRAGKRMLLSLDHLHTERTDVTSIRCTVSHQKVRFARYRPFTFWNRVREAFIGSEMN